MTIRLATSTHIRYPGAAVAFTMPTIVKRAVAFTVPVALGALALAMMVRGRTDPKRRPPEEQGRAVRVIEVAAYDATPRAVGYGVVRSQRQWEMVAEVSGRVIELNDDLQTGRILRKGARLIKIDPQDYKITATQQKATVANAKAQLSELSAKERNTKASLKIAQRSLDLAGKDFERVKQLYAGGNATASEVDDSERQVLTQKTTVQNLKNTLAEIPANRRALKAQIDQYRAGVRGAELDIARTELDAPFDIRISSVNVELSELVSAGATLAVGDGIDVAEVPAQFSIGSLAPLIPNRRPDPGPTSTESVRRLRDASALQATVRLESGQLVAHWEGVLDRFEKVDSETRTVTVVVAVDKPFARARPGQRAPLVSGMYVEVELRGKPIKGCKAIPRSAVRGDAVHVVGEQSRLQTRTVEVEFYQDAYACIGDGLQLGDQVVLTELSPAIEGMLLDPRVDEPATASLASTVQGPEQAS